MDDLIGREVAISAIEKWGLIDGLSEGQAIEILADKEKVPSAQSEIIYCKDCKKNNISVEDTRDQYKKWCPLVAYRGKAEGHEFDYQFCAFAERKTDDCEK